MADPYHHAESSSRRWGGTPEDYIAIHEWFDWSKGYFADGRHRALRHHAQGIQDCVSVFGHDWTIASTGRVIPTRWIGEQHVREDHGFIPSLEDWLREITPKGWMYNARGPGQMEGRYVHPTTEEQAA